MRQSNTLQALLPSDRTLGELGLLFGLLGIAGVGVPMIWPDQKDIGILFIVVGVLGFAVVLALMIIRVVVSKKVTFAMILMMIGTFMIVGGTIVGLIGAFQVDNVAVEPPSVARPLANLTNAQLRERAITVAQGLRVLEDEYDAKRSNLSRDSYVKKKQLTTKEEKDAEWEAYIRQSSALGDALDLEFKNRFRSDAIILREEFLARLKTLPVPQPRPFFPPIGAVDTEIFEKPFLAGNHPLSRGADLIEYWAKQLP